MGLALFAGAVAAVATLFVIELFLLMKVVLWVAVLPFRLLFWALALPLVLFKLVVGVVLFTLLAVGGAVALAGIFFAILLPLLPLALLIFATWTVVGLLKRPAAA